VKITCATYTVGLSLPADLGMFGGYRLRNIDVPVSKRHGMASWQPRIIERSATAVIADQPAYVRPSVPLSRPRARSLA